MMVAVGSGKERKSGSDLDDGGDERRRPSSKEEQL